MKVYVLTADVFNEYYYYGAEIKLFGVFLTEEKAKKQASKIELVCYDIHQVNVDATEEQFYLGGYIE